MTAGYTWEQVGGLIIVLNEPLDSTASLASPASPNTWRIADRIAPFLFFLRPLTSGLRPPEFFCPQIWAQYLPKAPELREA